MRYLLLVCLFLFPITTNAKLNSIFGLWEIKKDEIHLNIRNVQGDAFAIFTLVKEKANVPLFGKITKKDGNYILFFESPPYRTPKNCVASYGLIGSGTLMGKIFDTDSMLFHVEKCKGEDPKEHFMMLTGKWKKVTSEIQVNLKKKNKKVSKNTK